jgi:hypothetical protein
LKRAAFQDTDRRPIAAGALRPGVPIKVEGRAEGPDRFLAKKVRLLSAQAGIEIEGIVRRVFSSPDSEVVELEIAGLRVLAQPKKVRRAIGKASEDARAAPSSQPQVELELYDLGSDPAEKVNLVERSPDRVRLLLGQLEAWEKSAASRSLKKAARAPLDEETLSRLRALGYVQ